MHGDGDGGGGGGGGGGGSSDHPVTVTVQSRSLLLPSKSTTSNNNNNNNKASKLFLSNIDHSFNYHIQSVYFFAPKPGFPPPLVSHRLKTALSQLLDGPYHFMAGRLILDRHTGRLQIHCNAKGAGFVVAASACTLEQLGDLAHPNPAFRHLAPTAMDFDQPLCIFQLTSFKCGGFAMGVSYNHTTMDGRNFKRFLDNLAATAAGKPLPFLPYNDRRLLAARSPPHVTFHHPELIEHSAEASKEDEEELEVSVFRLTSGDVSRLKEKAGRASGYSTLTALVWKCKAASSHQDPHRSCTVLFTVDMRGRVEPPLPPHYTGNASMWAYASATCGELGGWALREVVERVEGGARRITDAYVRSVVDSGRMFGLGDLQVTLWKNEVAYPWGRPLYSTPVGYPRSMRLAVMLPGAAAVNLRVALPAPEMSRFRACFHHFTSFPNSLL